MAFFKPAVKTQGFILVQLSSPFCLLSLPPRVLRRRLKIRLLPGRLRATFSLRAGQGSRNWLKGNCINVHDWWLGWGSNKTYCLSKHIEIYKYKALDSAKSHNHYQRGLLKDRWQQPETFLPEMHFPFQTTFQTFELSTNDKSARHKFYKMVDWQCFKFIQNLKSFWKTTIVFLKRGCSSRQKRCNLLRQVDSKTVPKQPNQLRDEGILANEKRWNADRLCNTERWNGKECKM